MKEKAKDQGKEKTVVLNTRDLVLLFVFFVVVLMIVFTIGLLVGKNFAGEPQLTERRTPAADESNVVKTGTEESLPPIQEIPLPPPKTGGTPAGLPPSSETIVKTSPPSAEPEPAPAPKTTTPATSPAPAPAEPAPAAGTSVTYIVQALATRDLAEARSLVDKLKAKGYDAFVKVAQPGAADQFNRVQVGRFKDMEHARELVARLKKDGFDAFPRKVLE